MKEDVLTKFASDVAFPYIDEVLVKTALDFYQQKDDKLKEFLDVLKRVFVSAKEFAANTDQEVAYISFAILRTNILYGKYIYDVHVYNKNWYFNDYVKIDEMDVIDFFRPLDMAKTYLLSESKKFVGKINASDIDNIISEYLHPFTQLFIKMFRYVLLDVTECSEYVEIPKADVFRIYVGELYEAHYVLFEEVKERLSFEQLAERLKYGELCQNLDMKNSNFQDISITNADLQYSDFRGSSLKRIDFSNSLLEGCLFVDCNLAEANFNGARLSEANFQNADLRRSDLAEVVSVEGIFDNKDWDSFYKLPLILNGANMCEAVIKNAILHGVDFTQAKLNGANFMGSDLLHCKFKKEQLLNIELTEKQRSQIILEE